MKVQTYTARSVKEAVRIVRDELGPDAVILESREKSEGGRTWGEVRAAPASTRLPEPKKLFSKPKPINKPYGAAAYARQNPGDEPRVERQNTPSNGQAIDGELKALRRELRRVAEVARPNVDPIDQAMRSIGQQVDRSLEETHDLLRTLLRETRGQSRLDFSPAQAELYALMTHNGVEELLAEDLVRSLSTEGSDGRPLDLRRQLAERLLSRVRTEAPLSTRRGRQVVGFFGPTGVGKTTTIAKVAADASLRYGRRVGLITTDTYRIAAVEQLKAYADILELPLEVARDRAELETALRKMRKCDLVLVDTAGRNPKDESAVKQLSEQLPAELVTTRMLCVAAGTNPRTLAEVLRAFKPVNVGELVMTKMDECVGHGGMLNAHLRTGHPLTYFTTGQRVPEDLESASAERLVRLVLEQWVVG